MIYRVIPHDNLTDFTGYKSMTCTVGSRHPHFALAKFPAVSAHIHSKNCELLNIEMTPQSQMPRFFGRSDLCSDPLHNKRQSCRHKCRRMCQNLCKKSCSLDLRFCNSIVLNQECMCSMMPGWGLHHSLNRYSRT